MLLIEYVKFGQICDYIEKSLLLQKKFNYIF